MLKSKNLIKLLKTNMSSFKQILNPITGRSEWEPVCDEYDFHQEIARAAFADMLHDTERNQKYFHGLKKAIDRVHEQGRLANVLDIGTGTGILSMMAVKCGADTVTACEAFRPMADCAEKILQHNCVRTSITLIKKRSTDIEIGVDMVKRANILVTEVFDTELIGEGAIGIFRHAHEQLLERDCIVVPHSATMYAQVVESPLCYAWNMPKVLANLDGDILLNTPSEILKCKGSAALHDVQLSQLPENKFTIIIEPIAVLNFDWSGRTELPTKSHVSISCVAQKTGTPHAVFMWWDLKMDQDNEILLSCAPFWAHPDYETLLLQSGNKNEINDGKLKPQQNLIPWRDHWMQAIYYLPNELRVQQDEQIFLNFFHDEYSLWFDVTKKSEEVKPIQIQQPLCDCGFHNAYSRTRIGQLNDSQRIKKYMKQLEKIIDDSGQASIVLLNLNDGSLLGLSASSLGVQEVICLESHRLSYQVMEKYIKFNKLTNVKLIESLNELSDEKLKEITHIFGEPNFISSIVPFDNFYFGTLLSKIQGRLSETVNILPKLARIYAVPVEFLDLYKIRSPLGICEGFDLCIFDELIELSSNQADDIVEAQPLWEYPCRALAEPKEILSVNFIDFLQKKQAETKWEFQITGTCNGIAIWTDFQLDNKLDKSTIVTGGPVSNVEIGKIINWDIHTRQGVHLLPKSMEISSEKQLICNVSFNPIDGNIDFKFDY